MQPWLPILVTLLYLLSGYLFCRIDRYTDFNPLWGVLSMVIACLAQAVLLFTLVDEGDGHSVNLSIFNVIALFSWVTACASLVWLWKREMALGGILISIINALMVVFSSIFMSDKPFTENITGGMIWHILLSIAAWTVLTISLIYGVLYSYLYQRLKQKKIRNINASSLSNLERAMMLYAFIGCLLLIASLLSGWIFVDDMFAKHLRHKTILTIASAVIYAVLLWKYFVNKRHGMTLVYWSLTGYSLLIAGYVISNIILQFMVHLG